MEDVYKYFNNLGLEAEEIEISQNMLIRKLVEYFPFFEQEMDKALKNSIFEYKILNIFAVGKDDNQYKLAKNNCPNLQTKLLFHGSKIDSITSILSDQFRDANIHIFGKGVYFTDMLDYGWYYAGEEYQGNFNIIPRINDTFSLVASEVFYDETKKQTVYNVNTRDIPVERNGIRCAYVNYDSRLLRRNELENYNQFKGNEFCVTDKDQILPLYMVTLKRFEYVIIWRDYNFSHNNPNNYVNDVYNKMKLFHRNIKTILEIELNTKVYYVRTTEEAIELLNRKKYNKVIIITNGNNAGQEFIMKTRRIIGGNTIMAVTVYDISKHINWIKNIRNVLLLNGLDFHTKFFKAVINNDLDSLNQLRNEINNYYSNIPNFYLGEFSQDLFEFPNFKGDGSFEDLRFNNNESRSGSFEDIRFDNNESGSSCNCNII